MQLPFPTSHTPKISAAPGTPITQACPMYVHKTSALKGAALGAPGLVRCPCLCELEKICPFLLVNGVWAGFYFLPSHLVVCPCASHCVHKSLPQYERTTHQRGSFKFQLRWQRGICQLRRSTTHSLFLNKDCQASPKVQKENCRPANNKEWIIDS